jgi:processive 1,2-diacylglycerol beta-glucosyltransferase
MINLREKDTDKELGRISEAQFQFLVDQLEEESMEDNDYAISKTMLDYFESQGADPELVSLLRNALAGRDEMDIVWSKN